MYSEIKKNLEEFEDLCEMANLKSQRTNLIADLWVEEKGDERQKSDNLPRVKVKTKNHGRFPISISENPEPLEPISGFKKEDLDIINNAKPYIKRNRDILLQYYNGEIDIEDLLDELANRNDYTRNNSKKKGSDKNV